MLFDPGLVTPAWIEEEWRINNSPGAHEAFACIADYIRDGIDDDVMGGRLAAMDDRRHSTAIIWGREDMAVQVDVGHRCRDLLKPALYQEIPETGHGPYLEKPEVFNELLIGFLARKGVYPPASAAQRRFEASSS